MSDKIERIDINEIKAIIPHRYPFLLVDRVVDFDPNKFARGIKNVTVNEPFFDGHFPAEPVMPGVLVIEAMAQTSAVMVGKSQDLGGKNMLVYFMSIDKVKFRRKVVPGDVLELTVETIRGGGKIWKFKGNAFVGKEKVAEAEFTAMIVPPEGK